MHETAADLGELQELLDASHGAAGSHLRGILREEGRLSAEELSRTLTGVQTLALATVTADCAPMVGGVDGLFYRGRLHFGSSPDSVRARHLDRNAEVSAAHLRGEELAVVVHGTAVPVDVFSERPPPFRDYLVEVYPDWEEWYADGGARYWRIEPRRMLAARLPAAGGA
jgi:hypothetical protein